MDNNWCLMYTIAYLVSGVVEAALAGGPTESLIAGLAHLGVEVKLDTARLKTVDPQPIFDQYVCEEG